MRELKFYQAIQEALDLCLAKDPRVFLMGLGVPDPKGIFGTTLGLEKKYGSERVRDMPASENAMTGVGIGAAMVGMRPVMVHQRLDFALLAVEQMVNQAAKWHFMFGGKASVPLVIRLIVGRGWGQGPQHSQSLQSWFAHVPGLKVVMPATPQDAKGLMISSIEDNNPVIFIEHRWLHNTFGPVPEGIYRVPLGPIKVAREGRDITLAATSYMVLEALKSAAILEKHGIEAEVLDIHSLRPFDQRSLINSLKKTGRLIVADTSWKEVGFSAEVLASAAEAGWEYLKAAPVRLGTLAGPVPTSPALSPHFYPGVSDIVKAAFKMLGLSDKKIPKEEMVEVLPSDVPDSRFTGPF